MGSETKLAPAAAPTVAVSLTQAAEAKSSTEPVSFTTTPSAGAKPINLVTTENIASLPAPLPGTTDIRQMKLPRYEPGFQPEFAAEYKKIQKLGIESGQIVDPAVAMVQQRERSDGQQLSMMSTQTQAARDEAALASTGANVVDASSRTNITNNNQTVSVSGPEIPDRTSGVFMMRFGY